MKAFLEHVAVDLLGKFGNDLSGVTVVFPNKRASLFLNSYLSSLSDRPIWSPRYVTISDLFREQGSRTVADPLWLVCELHKSFTAKTGIDETLDHFYGWGELLLSDFDDLDKNMADADKVLANLRDLHELDGVDFLTDEQKEALRKFFSNFTDDHNTLLKERFLKLWSRMADIYHDFNSRLVEQGMAYEGSLYREVVDKPLDNLKSDVYAFVGFNLLQRVEQELFTMLKREGRARFYWDFDKYYIDGGEAGHFISQYLSDFPNELDSTDDDLYGSFEKPKQISFVSAPTDNVQARYVSTWLKASGVSPEGSSQKGRMADGLKTAVVLCDEKLLPMVIHCIPSEAGKANITTGYPLVQSPVASLITHLFNLNTIGYDTNRERYRLHYVNALLRHPYIACLSPCVPQLQEELNTQKVYYPSRQQLMADEGLSLLFGGIGDGAAGTGQAGGFNALLLQWMCDVLQSVAQHSAAREDIQSSLFMREALFRTYTLLNRLHTLVSEGSLTVDMVTLQRLVTQLLQSASVPFHGEPIEGLQVMGLLETRNLDFEHVLLLSCNEGTIPRGINDTSFIPYSIRKAYGLTTTDHKVAIYSYYFHRLLQRASDVTLVYNNSTTDGHTGEMSRFMLQLMVEDRHHSVAFNTLRSPQQFIPFNPRQEEKTPEVMERLRQRFALEAQPPQPTGTATPLLTPTAINRYMRCPLIFYYNYVYGLREPDVDDEEVIDNRIFGNIFHEAARIIYTRLMGRSRQILAGDIEQLLKTRVDIERAVDEAFRTELFRIRDTQASFRPELNGLQLIGREVIIQYLRILLETDKALAPFTIMGLETDVVATLSTTHINTTVGGRIDRLDRVVDGEVERIRVIDYKTGGYKPKSLASVEDVFKQESLQNHSDYYLQTLLYAIIVSSQQKAGETFPVAPALLFVQHNSGDNNPILMFGKEYIGDVSIHASLFSGLLRSVVDEMFCPDTPFVPTTDRSRCRNCPYKTLCSSRPAVTSTP